MCSGGGSGGGGGGGTKHPNYYINLAESIHLLSQQYLSSDGTQTTKTTSKF